MKTPQLFLKQENPEAKFGDVKTAFFHHFTNFSFPFTHFATLLRYFLVYIWDVKVIRFILALYIAVLTVYPCSDPSTCKDELLNGVQAVSITDHEHSTDEQDTCTPFCICSCCAAHIRLSSTSEIQFACVIHNTKEVIPYIEKQAISDYNHIWQPPRI